MPIPGIVPHPKVFPVPNYDDREHYAKGNTANYPKESAKKSSGTIS